MKWDLVRRTRVYRGCRGGDEVETGTTKETVFGLRMGLG